MSSYKKQVECINMLLFILSASALIIKSKERLSFELPNINFQTDNTIDADIVVEESSRKIKLSKMDEQTLPLVVNLLETYKAPPKNMRNIVDEIGKIPATSDEELLKSGAISFAIVFIDNLLKINSLEDETQDKPELNAKENTDNQNKNSNSKNIKNIKPEDLKIDPASPASLKLYISSDKDVAQSLGIPFPGIYGFNANDKVEYKMNFMSIHQAISTIMCPIFSDMKVETLKIYDDTKLPRFFLFYDAELKMQNKDSGAEKIDENKESKSFNINSQNFLINRKPFYDIALKYKNKVKIGLVPYNREKSPLGSFNISENNLPALISVHNNKKYRESDLTPERLNNFLEDFVNGKVQNFLMSSDEPTDNETRDVKEITRNSYSKYFVLPDDYKSKNDDIENTNNVLPTFDALVVFSSPSCRFCITLKPELVKLAQSAKKNCPDKVIVANVDATKNDFPEIDIKGYPTITLISGGKIFYYEGNRSIEDMAKFIKTQGLWGVDVFTGECEKEQIENEKIKDVPVEPKNEDNAENLKEKIKDEKTQGEEIKETRDEL
ncbi:hypothetical protein EDEG_00364 [Edhazardia aedis USNM 41457]|uniref:Thioredoxin domain-containing protein n=1 Tax=Edhazardia aedis (strain USNM 41457) TaxID=1003232 RepID=J8ZQ03_EDHAE|nr:hypothetical protein EDEG_00364 [Edhazardia aedis USNM 41457]|eukprot:EJW01773.1 hypothetical protein EDEG_00364 [Edhazardia aedis USNM 41457]